MAEQSLRLEFLCRKTERVRTSCPQCGLRMQIRHLRYTHVCSSAPARFDDHVGKLEQAAREGVLQRLAQRNSTFGSEAPERLAHQTQQTTTSQRKYTQILDQILSIRWARRFNAGNTPRFLIGSFPIQWDDASGASAQIATRDASRTACNPRHPQCLTSCFAKVLISVWMTLWLAF